MRIRLAIVSATLAAFLGPAGASANLIGAEDVGKIVNMARGHGSADATTASNGDPMIEGRIDGVLYVVHFYGCRGGKGCREIQFRASWNTNGAHDVTDMNEWNRTRRFGKAYLDSDGAPVIEMLINLQYGVSPQNLDDSFDWWRVVLQSFRDEIIDR